MLDLCNNNGIMTVENRDHKITLIWRCLHVEIMYTMLISSCIGRFVVCHVTALTNYSCFRTAKICINDSG